MSKKLSLIGFAIILIISLISCKNAKFDSTTWRGVVGDEVTMLIFSESHVAFTTPSEPDGNINYPYSISGATAIIDTGWEKLKVTISGSILTLTLINTDGEEREEFKFYRQ